MSNHRTILLRSDSELDRIVEELKVVFEYHGTVFDTWQGDRTFVLEHCNLFIGPSISARKPTDRPDEWYPPIDTYEYSLLVEGRKGEHQEHIDAARLFDLLKRANKWSVMLTDDCQTILERYDRTRADGTPIIDEIDTIPAVKAIPRPSRSILVAANMDLIPLRDAIAELLEPGWKASHLFNHLIQEIDTYLYDYKDKCFYLEANPEYSGVTSPQFKERQSEVSKYRYQLNIFSLGDAIEDLNIARSTFALLKDAKRWPLLLVENLSKVLERFDPKDADGV